MLFRQDDTGERQPEEEDREYDSRSEEDLLDASFGPENVTFAAERRAKTRTLCLQKGGRDEDDGDGNLSDFEVELHDFFCRSGVQKLLRHHVNVILHYHGVSGVSILTSLPRGRELLGVPT